MITTFQQHLLQQQISDESENFSWLLSGITLATKMIEAKIRRAGLSDILGEAGAINIQSEAQQKLDVYANQTLLHCLGVRNSVLALVSEENEEEVIFDRRENGGKYIVIFDPLDGSSNIDVNVNVGTIFSILRCPPDGSRDIRSATLQSGESQIAAGYVLYGPSTMLVYTAGSGVYGFTLDPNVGAYVLSHEKIRMPERGKYYSCNDANLECFPDEYQAYLASLRSQATGKGYSSRYIGSLVADFHRTLLKGGVYLYPPTSAFPEGKLRLLYEANPLAFIAEQAGGMAVNGKQRILSIQPETIHQRTSLVVGSRSEVMDFSERTGSRSTTTAAGQSQGANVLPFSVR